MSKEYQAPTVGQSPCSYSLLANISNGKSVDNQVPSQSQFIVPKLCPNGPGPTYPPSYSTLQNQNSAYSCGGYFSFTDAYPFAKCGVNGCSVQYTTRHCTGNINDQCNQNGAKMRR